MLGGRLERVERELEQLGAASEGDDERRTWLRGVLTDERDRLQPKLSQIATPAGRAEALGYPY